MAVGAGIVTQIKSIKSTQKITSAMELVAASKMRKAQERMRTSRPYANKLRQVIHHVAQSHSEYHHPYLLPRTETKKVGFVVIASDRGLCGGLNTNLFKHVLKDMAELQKQNIGVELCVIGRRAESFFGHLGAKIEASVTDLGDNPAMHEIIGAVQVMLTRYNDGKIDQLFVAYNEFVNTMIQEPQVEQLLPLAVEKEEVTAGVKVKYWDYIYEPDAKEILDTLLIRYIETLVYQSVVENIACEQAARMVAMKNATENAGQFIDDLQLAYNKARQAAITAEIAEICAGAEAV